MQAKVTSFGATLLSVKHEVNGVLEEITLNHSDLDKLIDMKLNPKYGATCGRTAGRIAKGHFQLHDLDKTSDQFGKLQQFDLEKNNGVNNLHGGSKGFDQRVWDAEVHILTCGFTKSLISKDVGLWDK